MTMKNKFNINSVEKILADYKLTESDLIKKAGLSYSFFRKLKEAPLTTTLKELIDISEYLGIELNDFILFQNYEVNKLKIKAGKKIFRDYDKYKKRLEIIDEPELPGITQVMTNERVQSSEIKNEQMSYIIKVEEYSNLKEIINIMDFILDYEVARLISFSRKQKTDIRKDLTTHLVYGLENKYINTDNKLINKLSNNACLTLIDMLYFKKIKNIL